MTLRSGRDASDAGDVAADLGRPFLESVESVSSKQLTVNCPTRHDDDVVRQKNGFDATRFGTTALILFTASHLL
jgi:hypothetical protein